MPKFTYPIVFILNEETGAYNGFMPDLLIYAIGETLEDVYAEAEYKMHVYFKIALREEIDFPEPTSLEDVSAKWKGYKVSLLTANLPD
ncbi:MAG: type II toxin-antitoxin system HicB family antitoxin [Firmicutes bacterium]|nr:type II toxin-antitoxin system HicB family antitoxin [Bacillota bacterium]